MLIVSTAHSGGEVIVTSVKWLTELPGHSETHLEVGLDDIHALPQRATSQQGSTPYNLIASQAAPPTGNQCSNT